MKARIVQGGIGTYEVQVKTSWLSLWKTVYNGPLPWRGSFQQAKKIKYKIENKLYTVHY